MTARRGTAFVTGASYGIGAATAAALARDGFDLAITARKLESLCAVKQSLEAAGANVHAVALDIRSADAVRSAIAAAARALGPIDLLVNNAGTTLHKPVLETSPAEWADLLDTNVTGTFLACQEMGRHLVGTGRAGSIINIASTHGLVAMPGRTAYGVSKAAIIHLTRMLAVEWAPHRIRVNAVAPGRVESNSPLRGGAAAEPAYLEAALKRIPLQRFASVEDVAEAVAYLANPVAAYITGHTLVLDGGVTAQ